MCGYSDTPKSDKAFTVMNTYVDQATGKECIVASSEPKIEVKDDKGVVVKTLVLKSLYKPTATEPAPAAPAKKTS